MKPKTPNKLKHLRSRQNILSSKRGKFCHKNYNIKPTISSLEMKKNINTNMWIYTAQFSLNFVEGAIHKYVTFCTPQTSISSSSGLCKPVQPFQGLWFNHHVYHCPFPNSCWAPSEWATDPIFSLYDQASIPSWAFHLRRW